jgi:ribosomal protein S18 acetylase RimI-like enzyme
MKKHGIRPVKIDDLDQLFSMLVELVKHEGTFKRFKLTRTRLEDELFGCNADWNCLVATNNQEKPIGFCLYTFANINRVFNESPLIHVDDLYLSPEYRNLGIAQHFFYQLALIAKAKNIG